MTMCGVTKCNICSDISFEYGLFGGSCLNDVSDITRIKYILTVLKILSNNHVVRPIRFSVMHGFKPD